MHTNVSGWLPHLSVPDFNESHCGGSAAAAPPACRAALKATTSAKVRSIIDYGGS